MGFHRRHTFVHILLQNETTPFTVLMGLPCLAEKQQSSRLRAAAPWLLVATQLQPAPNYKEMSFSGLLSSHLLQGHLRH